MFGLGLGEILIILIVAVIFVNPEDLPKFFRRLGGLVQQLSDVKESSARYLKKIEREIAGEDQ